MDEKFMNLSQDDIIKYNNREYKIISRMQFIESNYMWYEHIMVDTENGDTLYLDVEPYGRLAIFEKINEKLPIEFDINYKNEQFHLKQKGHARIGTYSGYNDVYLNEIVNYYEYISERSNSIIYIEKWSKEIEYSIGKSIDKKDIKIIKGRED